MNNLHSSLQVHSKLEKETTNLTVLKDKVQQYHDLSKSLDGILNVFETILGKLEKTILPYYEETEQLQKRQQNLESTLKCLETVLAHYDISQEVCQLIHQGPIEGRVCQFLEALGKLRTAMDYFLHHNSQSVELENVTSLFNTGCEGLNAHYTSLLKKHSVPLKPIELLDLIYIEDDASNDEFTSFRQLSQTTREELCTISHWLEQNLRREYTVIYAYERGEVVLRSLQNLKDHQKSNSWGTEALKPPRHSSRNEIKKNTSARLQQIFEKKANKLYLRATQTFEQSTGFSIKKASTHSEQLTVEDYLDGDQELDKYLVMLLGLQRLLNWERSLMNEIIPTPKHTEVFSKLANNSIDLVVKDAEAITNRVLRCITRKEWTSALGIFSALKRVILLQPDIERTYDTQQRVQLTKVLKKLQNTGSKALEHFLDVVKGEQSSTNIVGMSSSTLGYVNVPRDATVHELTSNTIWFIEHLYDHYDVIGSILQQDVLYSTQLDTILMKKTLPPEDRNRALLAIYIKKALAELNLSIMNKCEQYSDQATKHLFRLNNIHYILKSLQRSNLINLVTMAEQECENSYLDMIRELKFSYQKTWSKMLASIAPIDELPKPVHGKVKDKDRSILKERFSTFNKDFEEACKVQRSISIPDVILREGIKRDNVEHIIPKYNRFYEMYATVQFSKNPDKYVKYRPHEINAMLTKLFDDSA